MLRAVTPRNNGSGPANDIAATFEQQLARALQPRPPRPLSARLVARILETIREHPEEFEAALVALLAVYALSDPYAGDDAQQRLEAMTTHFGLDVEGLRVQAEEEGKPAEPAAPKKPPPAAKPPKGEHELLSVVGVAEASLEWVSIANKFQKTNPTKPEPVKAFELDGRFWVNPGGCLHGDYREWTILPLYPVAEYETRFGNRHPTRLRPAIDYDADEATQERQQAEYYTGVLVSYKRETYAIGPKAEGRTLTNGKARPKRD